MKKKFYAWFDVSNNLDIQRRWTRQYVEFDRTQRTLTFHSNECIRSINDESKAAPICDINSEMISLSSSSSSSSSLYAINNGRSIVHTPRSNYMLHSLSEYLSPSLSKTILSSSTMTDEKTATLTSRNNYSTESDLLSDRSSSITTTRQSKTKFSHFFGRSSNNQKSNRQSLKRTKSVTKLRPPQPLLTTSHLNIPSTRSRSHESLFIGNGPLGSILPAKPAQIMLDNCHVCRLHPSIVPSADLKEDRSSSYQYIEIRNTKDNENCYLRSKQYLSENNLLVNHLRYNSLEKTQDALRIENSLDIWILEAKGLPNKKKYYVKICLDDVIYGKTTNKERRDILFWGENFVFKDLPEGCSTLSCKIYREIERRKPKQTCDIDLIGSIDIPLSTIIGNQFIEQWYSLQLPNRKEKSLFSIRIKAKYQAIEILPIDSYRHFQEYIRRNYLRLIGLLEPHISLRDKDEIAMSLTRIAQSLTFSTVFLVDIVQAEVLSTPDNTLTFRGNSIATKSMEAYMKLIGETYLRDTLTRLVTDIIGSKNPNELDLEVDPDRVGNIHHLERNQMTLRLLCERIWSEIQQSHVSFPQELKMIFAKLRQLSSSDETMFNLISGSVFLRFLCPAILSPNLFGLTQEYPSDKASRKLTLIAKTLQTLANFSKFGPKESYMKFMNDFVSKESDNMRRFLANISTIDRDYIEPHLIDQDIDLGREYSILHTTLADFFNELDLNIRQSLNELECILIELSNIKLVYFSSKSNTQIHLHHVYHHPTNENRLLPYDSQMSLLLNGTGTTNDSSQGYHSISTSSTMTNIDPVRTPLTFTNPLYHKREGGISDLSDGDDDDSSKALYFLNSLTVESSQPPLLFVNNCCIKQSTQSLASSIKVEGESTRRQSSQQLPPKMGVKALNHTPMNKDSHRSPMVNLYEEEKCRRIECEKQNERLQVELNRLNEQLKDYRDLIHLINEKTLPKINDDDSKPIEQSFYSDDQNVLLDRNSPQEIQ